MTEGPRPQLLEILLEEDTLLMSFMDELRRLARPYEDDDDFLDEDLEEPFA